MSKYYDFTAKPVTAWLTINRECNFRCGWCYAKNTGYKLDDKMSLESAMDIVDIIDDMGVKNIVLTGGEPTMWKDLFELTDYIRTKEINSGLITNAALFGNDEFWVQYQQHPCDSARISIKGVTQDQMEQIAGVSKLYDQTLRGIERAIALHKDVDVGTVYASLAPTNDIELMAKVAKKLGAKSFSLSICLPTVSEGDDPSFEFVSSQAQLSDGLRDLYEYLNDLYNGEIIIDQSFPLCYLPSDFVDELLEKDKLGGLCHVQNRSGLVFNTNGDILLCNTINDVPIVEQPNYSNGQNLIDCLNNQELKDSYKEILRYPSKVCSECKYRDICHGGCLMNWTHLDPDIVCHAIN